MAPPRRRLSKSLKRKSPKVAPKKRVFAKKSPKMVMGGKKSASKKRRTPKKKGVSKK